MLISAQLSQKRQKFKKSARKIAKTTWAQKLDNFDQINLFLTKTANLSQKAKKFKNHPEKLQKQHVLKG